MVPTLLVSLLGRLMYTPEAASMSTLYALFDKKFTGGLFLSNSPNFWFTTTIGVTIRDLFIKNGLKKYFFPFALPINLIYQNIKYGEVVISKPNKVIYENPNLIKEFDQWSLKQIKTFLEFEKPQSSK